MKSFPWASLFVCAWMAAIAIGEEEKPNVAEDDIKRIEGTWKIEEVLVNGIKIEFDEVKKFNVVNGADGSWSLQMSGEVVSRGTSTYDPTKSPKEFEFSSIDGDGKEQHFHGIYELGENTRKICYTETDSPRPKEFASTPDNQCALVTLARVKAE